jgi:hypothetical protein
VELPLGLVIRELTLLHVPQANVCRLFGVHPVLGFWWGTWGYLGTFSE